MNRTRMTTMGIRTATIAGCLLAAQTGRAATHTWTNIAAGTYNWSSAANWDALPPNDGSADLIFTNSAAASQAYTATVDAPWGTLGSVNSIMFHGGNANSSITLGQGTGVTNLSIGAGGVRLDPTQAGAGKVINVNLNLAASQKWYSEMNSFGSDNRFFYVSRDVASPLGVNWVLGGRTRLIFNGGSSTGFLGQVTLNGNVCLDNTTQYGRLGTQPVIVNASPNMVAPGSVGMPRLSFNGISSGPAIMANAFELQLTNNVHNPLQLNITVVNGSYGTGSIVEFTNTWSGTIVGGNLVNGGHVRPSTSLTIWDDRYQFKFSGDASSLTGPTNATSTAGNQTLCLTRGSVILNHPHAWGTNNSLSILQGNWNIITPGIPTSLLATHGNTVNANIYIASIDHTTPVANAQPGPAILGLYGTGSVTFAGPIRISSRNTLADRTALNFLRLTAPSNGTARFTGVMLSTAPAEAYNGPMQILGRGDVVLAGTNQSFKGDTLIRSGRLLAAAPAVLSKGIAPISLGDSVSQPAGGTVRVATVIPPANVSTWAAGTYTFSSAPNIDGIVPVQNDRVLVKDANDAQRNGIYAVSTADGKTWVRASDLNEAAEFVYGLRVTVTSGTVNGGKAFFLMNRQSVLAGTFTLDTTQVGFNAEPMPNPDVALLTAAPVAVTQDIVVTNNFSSGASTLGGTTADASTFSGAVVLHRGTTFTAAGGGTATFSGVVSGTGSVVKVGAGVVRLTNVANSYSGGTSIRASVDDLTAGGRLEVSGTLDLSGAADTLTIIGTPDRNTTYTLATYSTLNGEFDTVTPLAKHTVVYNGPGNTILLKPFPTGSMLLVR